MSKSILFSMAVILFSSWTNAQSINSAWSASPASCDTQCAANALAAVTANNSGSAGSWSLIYSGSTTGSVSVPSDSKLISVNNTLYNPLDSFSGGVQLSVMSGDNSYTVYSNCTYSYSNFTMNGCVGPKNCGKTCITATYAIKEVWIYK